MTDTRYLVHGVFWDTEPGETGSSDDGHPVMRLQDPDGGCTDLGLGGGTRLGFRLAAEVRRNSSPSPPAIRDSSSPSNSTRAAAKPGSSKTVR